ncbi:MAG: ELWxxDGT repeat protein, partial [Gemmataceae bacterium]
MFDLNTTPDPIGSDPGGFVNVNGTLFFMAAVSGYGRELWKTDGTAAGTVFVKDVTPGSGGSTVSKMTAVGSKLYFI